MTPMIPKISVSPDATRNSNNPYCRLLRHWIKKVATVTCVRYEVLCPGTGPHSGQGRGREGRAIRVRGSQARVKPLEAAQCCQGLDASYILQPRPGSASAFDATPITLFSL